MADKTKYHQWFSEMKISLIKFLKITGLIFSLLLFLFIITSCSKKEFQRPTRAYYVNDFAEIFSSAVKKILFKRVKIYTIYPNNIKITVERRLFLLHFYLTMKLKLILGKPKKQNYLGNGKLEKMIWDY